MLKQIAVSSVVATGIAVAASLPVHASSEPLIEKGFKELDGTSQYDLQDYVEELQYLEQGTIEVQFTYEAGSFMSLFSLSNSSMPDDHFHLYISPSIIGFENRHSESGDVHLSADGFNFEEEYVHTLAISVDETYMMYLNGEEILLDEDTKPAFLSRIENPDSAYLGKTERSSGNEYELDGRLASFRLYDEAMNAEELEQLTAETAHDSLESEMPENALLTDPMSLFYPGFMDSNNYRIPALFETQNGTLLAGIDRRVNHGGDSPNDIHAVVRRSFDHGQTWEDDGIVINAYPDEASNIDLAFTEDTTQDRVFALVDGFPHGAGLMGGFGNNAYRGTGFTEIDGESYMYLTDEDDQTYTIREEGYVYDEAGNQTDYRVDEQRNLYEQGERIDHIFSATTPLVPFKTSYLELYYSDDEGENWSGPMDLNPETKEDWMIFLGVGPGNGIQLEEGEYEGRIVFPVYFLNEHNRQASAVIYSDDGGETWERGESPNENRLLDTGDRLNERDFTESAHEITEAQVVELPNGQLQLYMRNYSGFAQTAVSNDGGATWEETVETVEELTAPYSQMSVIRYDGTIDGQEALIFSSANDSSQRINGAVRVGLLNESTDDSGYDIDWAYEQQVKSGHYGYSSLATLDDGNIGLFYEGTPNTEMDFIRFNQEFLTWERYNDPPHLTAMDMSIPKKTPASYTAGETVTVHTHFDQPAFALHTTQLKGSIADQEVIMELKEVKDNKAIWTFELPEEMSPGRQHFQVQEDQELKVYNSYGRHVESVPSQSDAIVVKPKRSSR